MTMLDLIRDKREDIRRIAAKHGVLNIRVFGSVARGEAGPESDVDFLVEVGPATTSWFPAGLIVDLEDLLGRRVEVVVERALNTDLRDRVLQEAVAV
jgi:predicted nucleotidyltransferase